jgi:hypothetical protein
MGPVPELGPRVHPNMPQKRTRRRRLFLRSSYQDGLEVSEGIQVRTRHPQPGCQVQVP